jgi:hypothetical protein
MRHISRIWLVVIGLTSGFFLILPAGAEPLSGELAQSSPTERFGTLPTPYTGFFLRNEILDAGDQGQHNYMTHRGESKGIGYTCDIGFIDLDHVRDGIDRTAYLYGVFLKALRLQQPEVNFDGYDGPARYRVRFTRALTLDELYSKTPEIALGLAQRYAFLVLTWHEVLTWFGYRTFFLFPEQVSAFTYEDTVSNLIGTEVAATALTMRDTPFDQAATRALAQKLDALHLQSRNTTFDAMDKVKNLWWNSHSAWPFNHFVLRRDVDIGMNGQPIIPWLVPDVPACPAVAPLALKPLEMGSLESGQFADFDDGYIEPGMRGFWEKAFPQGRPVRDGQPATEVRIRDDLGAIMAEVDREMKLDLGEHADRPEP